MAAELSVIIPFFNEEKNVEEVTLDSYDELLDKKIDFELIIVNNGSTDSTPQLCNSLSGKYARIKAVHIEKNIGYGNGILSGINIATGKYICYSDGDGQIPARCIWELYHTAVNKNAEFVKAKRTAREGFVRHNLSRAYNLLVSALFLINVSDINAKPKLLPKNRFDELKIKAKDWFIDTEIVIKAKRRGYKIEEVPVEYLKREKGESQVRFTTIGEFIKNLIRFRLGIK